MLRKTSKKIETFDTFLLQGAGTFRSVVWSPRGQLAIAPEPRWPSPATPEKTPRKRREEGPSVDDNSTVGGAASEASARATCCLRGGCLVPQAAASIERDPYFHVLIMGSAKAGKTTSCIVSLVATFGAGYVICCGDKSGMVPATRQTKKFTFDTVRDETEMEACLKEARRGVKEGEYKWVLVDDFSLYASWLEGALRDASAEASKSKEPDGRRYWPEYKTRLLNIPRRLFDLKTHIIFAMHWMQATQEIDGQRSKSGVGIVPMIGGAAREELPALFQDVIFMEKEVEKGKGDRRVFKVNPEGVWGPGCRLSDGVHTVDADFGALLKLAKESDGKAVKGGTR